MSPSLLTSAPGFTSEQKEYLQGFFAGLHATSAFVGLNAAGQLTAEPGAATSPNLALPPAEDLFHGTAIDDLCKEERWKYEENPLDAWDRLLRHAAEDKFPDPEHTYRFKYFGLFYVAPAQDSFMLRLRVPACELNAWQLHGLADLAADLGGGYAHVTTRGNLQIREFKPRDLVEVLTRVQDLGLTSRGSGADNIRNITASPDSGFAPDELLDVRPFARGLHHYILNHRDLYGLPRKFNVAFDNGGSLSVAADTNDIGFFAVRVTADSLSTFNPQLSTAVSPGVYFRLCLGGITGHGDFAEDTGLLIKPDESVAVAAAMIRVFADHGDRTNRKKARLKYLLEKWGVEKFIAETGKRLAFPLLRLPLAGCEARRPVEKHGWLGVRPQAQAGLNSIGVGLPVGRITPEQMHALADLATRHGRGELRLTVWQNIILPHVRDDAVESVCHSVRALGLFTEAGCTTGGIVACTGSRGCKYAAADTKAHALALSAALPERVTDLDTPVNIHFTGCPHSCAQHYCGDIGFLGTKLPDGSEGYHVVLGGGMDHEQGIAREFRKNVPASAVPAVAESILRTFLDSRAGTETFVAWSRRQSLEEIKHLIPA
ncbi:MAG TPA: NirA family protein [Candidatus Didemnitutus sp.]|nr:NirA family protein [Candidatus Didemnitutus sp.]